MNGADDLDVPLRDLAGLPPEVGQAEVDVELEKIDSARALWHDRRVGMASDGPSSASVARMGEIRFGPARVPSHDSPDDAIAILLDRGYTACEIDFEGGFWMDYDWAGRFGELARDAEIALSVHAPLPAFLGHVERGKKFNMALGMLDHTAGIAVAAGAEVVVFHPGFLLGREREAGARRRRLAARRPARAAREEGPPRAVRRRGDGPRARARHRRRRVRDLGAHRLDPAGDRLRAHARDERRRLHGRGRVRRRARARRRAARPGAPFHIHFSDIAYANRNETKHLPYGEGTLRAEPLGEALAPVRAAGDGDQRVARRGVAPGGEGGAAARPELREAGDRRRAALGLAEPCASTSSSASRSS